GLQQRAWVAVADRGEQQDGIGVHAAGDEREDRGGGPAEPLRVLLSKDHGGLGGGLGQQLQCCEGDQERLWRGLLRGAERRTERGLLPLRAAGREAAAR